MLTTGSDVSELWLYDLRGRPPIPLAVGGAPRLGVFSPDGTQVAFGRLRRAVLEVHTTLADGSVLEPQPLRPEGLAGLPEAWSRAGDLIFVDVIRGADISTWTQ